MTEIYDGMSLTELYARECVENHGVDNDQYYWQFATRTTVTHIEVRDFTALQLRFETMLYDYHLPICQYVIWRDGRLNFRERNQWFFPGDILFGTFGEAIEYCKSLPPIWRQTPFGRREL